MKLKHFFTLVFAIMVLVDFVGCKNLDAPKAESFIDAGEQTPEHSNDKKIIFTDLSFEPGTEGKYSNTGFILLGAIIESVIGQSYYDKELRP